MVHNTRPGFPESDYMYNMATWKTIGDINTKYWDNNQNSFNNILFEIGWHNIYM